MTTMIFAAMPGCLRKDGHNKGDKRYINIKGSDTMVRLVSNWAETFMQRNPDIKAGFRLSTGLTALAGSVLLALMAIPTVVSISEDAIRSVPASYKAASLALGASKMYLIVQDMICTHPEQTKSLIHLLSASRHLERVADHATNIAEDVIYMIEGRIIGHETENFKS